MTLALRRQGQRIIALQYWPSKHGTGDTTQFLGKADEAYVAATSFTGQFAPGTESPYPNALITQRILKPE